MREIDKSHWTDKRTERLHNFTPKTQIQSGGAEMGKQIT